MHVQCILCILLTIAIAIIAYLLVSLLFVVTYDRSHSLFKFMFILNSIVIVVIKFDFTLDSNELNTLAIIPY